MATVQRTRTPRDAARSLGSLTGVPPCVEREQMDQSTPDGVRPNQKLCATCGRVTARRTSTGRPQCGGELVAGLTWTDPLPAGASYVGKGV